MLYAHYREMPNCDVTTCRLYEFLLKCMGPNRHRPACDPHELADEWHEAHAKMMAGLIGSLHQRNLIDIDSIQAMLPNPRQRQLVAVDDQNYYVDPEDDTVKFVRALGGIQMKLDKAGTE